MSSDAIYKMLEKDEGFVPHAYQDHLGYWTIGIGTLIDSRRGGGISKEAAYFLVDEKLKAIDKAFVGYPFWDAVKLDPARKAVIINMAYQMGTAGLLQFKTMLAAVADKRWADAAKAMEASLWAKQTPNRFRRMQTQMATGKFHSFYV